MPVGFLQATTAQYSAVATIPLSKNPITVEFAVSSPNSCLCQLGKLDNAGNPYWDSNEVVLQPGSGGFAGVYGFRVRTYQVATNVLASAFYPDDGTPLGFTPGSSSFNGGTVTPGGGSLIVRHNGATVATEPALDFEDGSNLTWTIADDIPNQQVKVTPVLGQKIVTGQVSSAGAVVAGTGFTSTLTSTGIYTITFNPVFAAAPTVTVAVNGNNPNNFIWVFSISGSTLVVHNDNSSGVATNVPFSFLAVTTV